MCFRRIYCLWLMRLFCMMAILSCKIMARHINQPSVRVVRIQWTFTPRYGIPSIIGHKCNRKWQERFQGWAQKGERTNYMTRASIWGSIALLQQRIDAENSISILLHSQMLQCCFKYGGIKSWFQINKWVIKLNFRHLIHSQIQCFYVVSIK